MKRITFQELKEIAHEEGCLSLKDVLSVMNELANNSGDDYEEFCYASSPRKRLRDLARMVKDEALAIHADSNDFHNLAVDYARLNMYDCAIWVLERGLKADSFSPDLLADAILYGTESGQHEICAKAYSKLMQSEKDSWGWRPYSFTIDYYLDKAKRLPKGTAREKLRIKAFTLADEFLSYAKMHPEEAADRALFKKASVNKRFAGEENQEDLLREGCNMVSPAPQCALRLADLLFNRGDYDGALNFLKQCILAIQKPQPDVNPSYVYLLYAMIRTSKLIAETSAGDYSSKEAETYGIYKDFHTALDKSYINTTYEEAVKRTIRVLELQTGFKDTTPAFNNEEFI